METLIAYLENIKNALPIRFSSFNLQRLKIQWADFKNFLISLPDQLKELRDNFLQRIASIREKIEAIESGSIAAEKAGYAFQEATVTLRTEMEAAIARIQASGLPDYQ
ncbi:MAG: hypothetical protein QM726_23320 [Chitinophagaceae bacterium]